MIITSRMKLNNMEALSSLDNFSVFKTNLLIDVYCLGFLTSPGRFVSPPILLVVDLFASFFELKNRDGLLHPGQYSLYRG